MGTVRVHRSLPGATVAEAERLWLDTARWPSFVDGFGHLARIEGDWPQAGSRLLWDSHPDGRGRVVERVSAYEPQLAQTVAVEDPRLRGTQTVSFAARDGGCAIAIELGYELKGPGFAGPLTDVLFIRRALRDSLQRTVNRFAREIAADRELLKDSSNES